ncbi:MAG: hypothetical protein Q8927_03745 [Bacteroidota bacterium]|nr:hypothetical protein [Bacteroidota bacterium]MDP4215290.1 hypothetical protein [Bacteroidota bacterium]MDP4245891.1 hypothetical protein [Bacteroidota bacterium]MDP4254284.1 hypothetical protein [Bacteroidota bacterium]MDP4259158.1 hypothetical protein [Bacteroidota bacterium]
MKQLTAIVLLFGMLGQTFSTCMVVLGYRLNKDFIARNLCENRNKPAMHCEGKCYLCKKLKKEDKKDQENPERRAENRFESLCDERTDLLAAPVRSERILSYPTYSEDPSPRSLSACFHPPQC